MYTRTIYMHTHRRIHRTEKDTHRILNTEDIIQFLHVLDKDLAKEFFLAKFFHPNSCCVSLYGYLYRELRIQTTTQSKRVVFKKKKKKEGYVRTLVNERALGSQIHGEPLAAPM